MNDFYVPLRQEFLDARFMRACLSKYLYDSGYYCCDIFFAQVRFKSDKQPKSFQNDLGFNLVYETLAYKPKDGWNWKRLTEEWFPSINQAKLPEQRDIDIRTFVKLVPYQSEDRYNPKAEQLQKKLDELPLWQDELAQKFDIIKVYFDILSGQFYIRPFDNQSFQQKFCDDRNEWYGLSNQYRKKANEQMMFCKWLSRYYLDDWYEHSVYDPDYIQIGVNCIYKITHEPYYEQQHKIQTKRSWSEKDEHLLIEDVPVSVLLSPLEIVQILYWINYSDWKSEQPFQFNNYFDIDELIPWDHDDMNYLWTERFINPATDVYPNRALFYTANVLELTTELKMDIASLQKDVLKLALETEWRFAVVRGVLQDISKQVCGVMYCQIRDKWARYASYSRGIWPSLYRTRLPSEHKADVLLYFDERPINFARSRALQYILDWDAKMNDILNDTAVLERQKQFAQELKQKYHNYAEALTLLDAFKKKLDNKQILSFDDVINLQKLAE